MIKNYESIAMVIKNYGSLGMERATIEGLPAETIAQLQQEFLDHAPERMRTIYARWFTKPRLPTLFIVWAYDVRAKRQNAEVAS